LSAIIEHNNILDHKRNENALCWTWKDKFSSGLINLSLLKIRRQKMSLPHLFMMALHNATVNHLRETMKRHWKTGIELYVFVTDINLVYIWYVLRLDLVYSL